MPLNSNPVLRHLRTFPRRSIESFRYLVGPAPFVLTWPRDGEVARNWGDKLNAWLAGRITPKRVVHAKDLYPFLNPTVHYWIGSHLGSACGDPRAVVWGAGLISADARIEGRPRAVHAVRGWKSAARLKAAGISVPDVVGDAALLMPRFHTPRQAPRRYSLGLIPHFRDKHEPFFVKAREWDDTLLIDISGSIEDVVNQIASCDRIVSSSLHGIICADAYGVPAYWVRASSNLLGDGFKFEDYFSSVGRPELPPLPVDGTTRRSEVEDHMFDYRIQIDLDALWKACPVHAEAAS